MKEKKERDPKRYPRSHFFFPLRLDLAFLDLDLDSSNPAGQLVCFVKDLAKVDHCSFAILGCLLLFCTTSLMGFNLLLESVLDLPSVALENPTTILGDAHGFLVDH